MPFYFIYRPVILDLAADPVGAVLFNVLLLFGMFGLCVMLDGYFFERVTWPGRLTCLLGSLLIFHPNYAFSWIGLGLILAFGSFHILLKKKNRF